MRTITIGFVAVAFLATASIAGAQTRGSGTGGFGSAPMGTGSNPSSNQVSGYTKNNGAYVAPYERTNPNSSKTDNYGASGNYNPNKPAKGW